MFGASTAGAEMPSARSAADGVYLSRFDFDMTRGSFGAELWVWSTCPDETVKTSTRRLPDAINTARLDPDSPLRDVWSMSTHRAFRTLQVSQLPFDREALLSSSKTQPTRLDLLVPRR